MSPVHVIVGDDPRAETMWAGAFTGAVDLYRFERNIDAFERLTAAEAPVDLVILTPAQRGPFNLTPDQFVARVLEGPLASGPQLGNLHVIVVGAPLQRSHPRAMSVSTLEAAIRLVKFGEVERAPRPATPAAPVAAAQTHRAPTPGELPFSGSVISRIWDAPDPREPDVAPRSASATSPAPRAVEDAAPAPQVVVGGGAPQSPQLFARTAAPSFVLGGGAATSTAPQGAPDVPAQVGAPGEAIEVGTGPLQPSRPYQLPNGGGYRGPAVRGGTTLAAAHGQPVPPALASQVQAMVYAGQVGNPNDPLLTWSSGARAAAPPVPGQQPAAPQGVVMQAQPAP
ncbi:MAG: hypothetical protein JWM86_760, partial [Thermoleophilia bacterium]|nr:hypothetical protein [Thermoleophilia bacterium]